MPTENDLLNPFQNSSTPSSSRSQEPRANFDLKALKAINRANAERRPPLIIRLKSILSYLFGASNFSFGHSDSKRTCKYNGHVRRLCADGRNFLCADCGKTITQDDRIRAAEPAVLQSRDNIWRAKSP